MLNNSKHNGILIDIDNTLYDYNKCHLIAMSKLIEFVRTELKISNFEEVYENSRRLTHIELKETASSHNRLIYFQKSCEILKINPLKYALKFYDIYWVNFLNNMILYDGVLDFLKTVSVKSRICIVTDLTAHIQYKKIEKLNISDFISHIVTSEEAGKEKPHPYIFLLALHKLQLRPDEVYMIGDSFEKDIVGAINLGIDCIWLNSESKKKTFETNIIEVRVFKDILNLI